MEALNLSLSNIRNIMTFKRKHAKIENKNRPEGQKNERSLK